MPNAILLFAAVLIVIVVSLSLVIQLFIYYFVDFFISFNINSQFGETNDSITPFGLFHFLFCVKEKNMKRLVRFASSLNNKNE